MRLVKSEKINLSMRQVFVLLIFFVGCDGDVRNFATPKTPIKWEKKVSRFWISVDYLNCLYEKLPCACREFVEYPVLSADTVGNVISFFDTEDREERLYLKINHQFYNVFSDAEFSHKLFEIFFKGDTLTVRNDTYDKKYVPLEINAQKCKTPVGEVNFSTLQATLKSAGVELISTLGIDSLFLFYCNRELANQNLLSKPGECKNMFFLSDNENKLLISRILNPCESKKVNDHSSVKSEKILEISLLLGK